jgi:hypothetical protein
MKVRLSYTAASTFKDCPEKHNLKYRQHIYPKEQGSSLDFGGSVDVGLSYLLNCKKEGKEIVGLSSYKSVFLIDVNRGWNLAFDDATIRYRKTDYDALVVSEDRDTITTWEVELGVTADAALQAEKQSPYKKFDGKELKMFNRLCWLSLKHKGELMLDAFVRDIYPNITKVIAVQHEIRGDIGEIASVLGVIDLVCEYKGYDKPIVFDIKTSAQPYKEHKPLLSEQLMLYLGATRNELNTNFAGYLIMIKSIRRYQVCKVCGAIKASKHQTCPNEVNSARCNGEWIDKPIGDTQVQVEQITNDKLDSFLQGFSNLAETISLNKPYKNFESCEKYGLCDYFYLCHYGDKSKYDFPENKQLLPTINEEKKNDVARETI